MVHRNRSWTQHADASKASSPRGRLGLAHGNATRLHQGPLSADGAPLLVWRIGAMDIGGVAREDLADALAAIGDIADELQIKFKLYPPARNALFGGATGSLSDVEKREEREREKRREEALAARPAALEAAAALSAIKHDVVKGAVPRAAAQARNRGLARRRRRRDEAKRVCPRDCPVACRINERVARLVRHLEA